MDLSHGVEWFVIPMTIPPAGSNTVTFNVTGWRWFMLMGASFFLDNSAGATVAQGACNVSWNGTVIARALSPFTIAAGAGELITMGIDSTVAQAVGFAQTCSLPKMPVLGEGTISCARQLAPANSVILSAIFTIMGVRYRNRI